MYFIGLFVIKERKKGCLDCRRSACPRGKSCSQREEIRYQLFNGTTQSMRSCHINPISRQRRTLHHENPQSQLQGCLHLSLKASTFTTFFGQNGITTYLLHEFAFLLYSWQDLFICIKDEILEWKLILLSHADTLWSMQDTE